ncbi:uncharacterized protein V1513DRAFT_428324 [Lipomyces chichibuensis]|uniref:uncharacterized protein n=1 Tax=Lipomyces chichibuensis TaxID=1546026 RepID=UPI00334405C2
MASRHRKSKADDLARVRDNQRRCRARRREYVAELERKVKDFEASRMQPNNAADLLSEGVFMRENEILRMLLKSLGLDEQFQAMYMNAELAASKISLAIQGQDSTAHQLPGLMPESPQYGVTYDSIISGFSQGQTTDSQLYSNLTDSVNEWLYDEKLGLSLESGIGSSTLSQSSSILNLDVPIEATAVSFPLAASGAADTACPQCPQNCLDSTSEHSTFSSHSIFETAAIDASSGETSIPCSTACTMIVHHNRKGYSQMELDIRLRRGFRKGHTPSDGCRVDSKVLFTVLAEIS